MIRTIIYNNSFSKNDDHNNKPTIWGWHTYHPSKWWLWGVVALGLPDEWGWYPSKVVMKLPSSALVSSALIEQHDAPATRHPGSRAASSLTPLRVPQAKADANWVLVETPTTSNESLYSDRLRKQKNTAYSKLSNRIANCARPSPLITCCSLKRSR